MPADTSLKGPTMSSSSTRALLLLALAATAAACGSSSSPAGGTGTPPTVNRVLQGAITARSTGVIEVNGVTMTTPATVKIEGVEKSETELHKGMVVRVRAAVSGHTGEAVEVQFEDVAKGKVEAKFDDHTLSVGGQTVRIDDSTEFEDNGLRLGSVAVNDRVRVSGVPDDKGGLRATRIDKETGTSNEFEVKGVVTATSGTSFTIKTSIDAAVADTYTVELTGSATLPAGFAVGSFVEVHSASPVQTGNVIQADRVTLEDRLGTAQAEAEVEGIVTSGTSASFVAAGVTVTTTDATLWTGGLQSDFVVGTKVEAEGTLQADGSLSAHKVSFRYSSKLQGAVSAKDAAASTLTVNGITVKVDGLTDQRTSFSGLSVGALVQVRGYLGRDGASLVATRLEDAGSGGSASRPIIQGVVTAKDAAANTITVLGKIINTASAEALRDYSPSSGIDGSAMPKEAFYAAITVGETVVKGTGADPAAFADPVLTAKEAELEGER
jgi:hypothetical protein